MQLSGNKFYLIFTYLMKYSEKIMNLTNAHTESKTDRIQFRQFRMEPWYPRIRCNLKTTEIVSIPNTNFPNIQYIKNAQLQYYENQ